MTTSARLDEIIQRQRTGRSLDVLFAMFIAVIMVLQVAGLRRAAVDSHLTVRRAIASPVMAAAAPAVATVGPACATATVC